MSQKSRTVGNFNSAVEEFCRTKSESSEATLQRCLQVLCCMENTEALDAHSSETLEFLANARDLLSAASDSPLGWKTMQLAYHLCGNPLVLKLFKEEFELLPVITQYSLVKSDAERTSSALTLLQKLLEDVVFPRLHSYVTTTVHTLVQLILQKRHEYSHIALAVVTNLALNNRQVFLEIQRLPEADELLRLLAQSSSTDILTQLNAALMLIFLKIETSVADGRFYQFFNFLIQLSRKVIMENNMQLANQITLIFCRLSEDPSTGDVLRGPDCQRYLENLVSQLSENCSNSAATNFLNQLLQGRILSETRNLDAALLPRLIDLIGTSSSGKTDYLLQLVAGLLQRVPNCAALLEKLEAEKLSDVLVGRLTTILSVGDSADFSDESLCSRVIVALQLLQRLCKSRSNIAKVCSALEPSLLPELVRKAAAGAEESDKSFGSRVRRTEIVVECLTLLGQVSCQGGDWMLSYSHLVSDGQIQRCLARLLLHGDSHSRQAVLCLVGNVGFTQENVAGLSEALCSVKMPLSPRSCEATRRGRTNYADVQWNRLERILDKVEKPNHSQVTSNDVVELLELKLKRCARQDQLLRESLEATEKQLANMRITHAQMQAENDQTLSALFVKDDKLRSEESNSRMLTRKVEKAFLSLQELKIAFAKEKAKLEESIAAQQTELGRISEEKCQLEGQYQLLLGKFDDHTLQLKKKNQEIEILGNQLQEALSTIGSLNGALKQKDSEITAKEKENESLQGTIADLKKELHNSQLLCKDYDEKLKTSDKICQETREELVKLERIRQYIHDLSAGNKKLLD